MTAHMPKRYLAWRKTLSNERLFVLALLETTAFLAAWAVAMVCTVLFVAAPLFFGAWGLGAWVAAYIIIMALNAVSYRDEPTP